MLSKRGCHNGWLYDIIYLNLMHGGIIVSTNSMFKEKMEVVFDIDRIVQAMFVTISTADISLSKKERQIYHSYIKIMAELGWPAYNDGDLNFHKRIVNLVETRQYEKIEPEIYNHYDAEYIKNLQDFMENIPIVNSARLTILKEAFTLYNLEYYYGSVVLLTSQIAGIVKDIERELSNNGISFDPNSKKLLGSRYKVSYGNEKAKVILTLLESSKYSDVEREHLYSIGYFRSILFSNKLEGDDLFHHTNRNMVFHGEQLTFGSKEQALKLILCIDMLYFVADVLYRELII